MDEMYSRSGMRHSQPGLRLPPLPAARHRPYLLSRRRAVALSVHLVHCFDFDYALLLFLLRRAWPHLCPWDTLQRRAL